jgi:alpha-tubulin suppressor-like RCC1 family protein
MKRYRYALAVVGLVAAIPAACTSNSNPPPPAEGNEGGTCEPPVTADCASCVASNCAAASATAQSDCSAVISCYCACNFGDTCCVEACGPEVTSTCVSDTLTLAKCVRDDCASDCTTVTVGLTCTPEAGTQDASDTGAVVPEASMDAAETSVIEDTGTDAPVDAGEPIDASDASTDASSDAGDAGPASFGAAVSVSVGFDMSSACAVTASGAAVCWGDDVQGDLGNGSVDIASAAPVQVTGLTSGVTSVSVGTYAACALQNGGVWCWGYNNLGQLGNGSGATYLPSPVQVTGLTSGVISVSMGYESACAVTSGGAVMCWGDNGYGQLGIGGGGNSPTPVQVTGLTSGFKSVTVGSNNACALSTSGDVMCWGDGSIDQLGNGGSSSLVPSQVTGLTSGATSVSIAAGNSACAVVNGGAVCWGDNTYGQLGNNSNTEAPTPVAVSGLASGVASVSVGEYSACALTTAGDVLCWGYDAYGELGNADGGMAESLVPQQVTGLTSGVSAVSAGDESPCAVVACGAVVCWGAPPATSPVPVAVPLLGGSSCP